MYFTCNQSKGNFYYHIYANLSQSSLFKQLLEREVPTFDVFHRSEDRAAVEAELMQTPKRQARVFNRISHATLCQRFLTFFDAPPLPTRTTQQEMQKVSSL